MALSEAFSELLLGHGHDFSGVYRPFVRWSDGRVCRRLSDWSVGASDWRIRTVISSNQQTGGQRACIVTVTATSALRRGKLPRTISIVQLSRLGFHFGCNIESFLNVCRKRLASLALSHKLQTIFFELKLLDLSTGRFRVVFNPENIFWNYTMFVSDLKFA